MFQVLVKTTAGMKGSYSYDVVSREAAQEFVQRSDVWWWVFPVDGDVLDGGSWRKGGAWGIAAMQSEIRGDLPAFKAEVPPDFDRERPAVPWGSQAVEDDDDRW